MKLLISAAEVSSDAHGAELLRALRQEAPAGTVIEAFGVGGPKLQAEGLRAVVDARELLAMGFTEVFGRLPRILAALKRVAEAASLERPDAAIVIDYPEFHFRLGRKLKSQDVKTIYYIPPKIWVWRKKRALVLKELFRRVLCIFPFEERFFREQGVPAVYVGNPLVDELPLRITRAEARKQLSLSESDRVLVMMPGSRPAELKRHVPVMLEAAALVAGRLAEQGSAQRGGKLVVLIPLPEGADAAKVNSEIKTRKIMDTQVEFRVSKENSALCMLAADAGLIKSGTSTLEAALLRCPHAVIYKPSWLTMQVFRHLVRYPGPVGLVNLLARAEESGRSNPEAPYVAREILGEDVSASTLAEEAFSLLTDGGRRQSILSRFEAIRKSLGVAENGEVSESASRRAAREILREIGSLAPASERS